MDDIRQKESLENPTDAMKELMARMEEREREREAMTWKQQLQFLTKKQVKEQQKGQQQWVDLTPNPLTPAMEEVIKMRQKRISVEIDIPITPEPSDSDEPSSDSESESTCSSHEEYLPPSKLSFSKQNHDFEFDFALRNPVINQSSSSLNGGPIIDPKPECDPS